MKKKKSTHTVWGSKTMERSSIPVFPESWGVSTGFDIFLARPEFSVMPFHNNKPKMDL